MKRPRGTALLACLCASVASGFVPAQRGIAVRPPRALRATASAAVGPDDWALIFDCDGVILESESLHREAYNAVFREFQVKYEWTPDYYDVLQNLIGGGIPKMRYYFDKNGWPESKLGAAPSSLDAKEVMLNTLQDRKTDIYKDYVRGGTAELRPGISRLIDEAFALKPKPKLAICSASTKSSCLFVLENLLGQDLLRRFDLILAGDDVPRRKPDPMIYAMACEKLDLPAERCIVIEDSLIGLQAVLGAGIKCVVTYTPSTQSQDFSGAEAVFPDLENGEGGPVTAKALRDMLAAAPVAVA